MPLNGDLHACGHAPERIVAGKGAQYGQRECDADACAGTRYQIAVLYDVAALIDVSLHALSDAGVARYTAPEGYAVGSQ